MDDRFLHEQRREPRPGFARDLRERLRRQEEAEAPAAAGRRLRLAPALAGAAAVAVVAALFLLPGVRASAQAFLDLFRVRTFAAVKVDPARLEVLHDRKLNLEQLVADRVEKLKEPGPPQEVATPRDAEPLAGIPVAVPDTLPSGLALEKVLVEGDAAARFTVDIAKLEGVLRDLDLRDVDVPRELDGSVVTVRVPRVVRQLYAHGGLHAELVQAASPEVELPAGADLARLGEIGLRILGMDAGEARRFARSIDWNGTVIVPVPADAMAFREVEVHGQRGLLISTTGAGPGGAPDARPRPRGRLLLWSEGEKVFALSGNLDGADLVIMANSLR